MSREQGYIAGFQFMPNKQFIMEKKIGNISVRCSADILQYALKNQYVQFVYAQIINTFFLYNNFGFCKFLDQIRLQKTVFWTYIKNNVFFSIKCLNIFILTKPFVDKMCIFFF